MFPRSLPAVLAGRQSSAPRCHPTPPLSGTPVSHRLLPTRFYLQAAILEDKSSRMTILHDGASGSPGSACEAPKGSETSYWKHLSSWWGVLKVKGQSSPSPHHCVMGDGHGQLKMLAAHERYRWRWGSYTGADSLPSLHPQTHPVPLPVHSRSSLTEAGSTDEGDRKLPHCPRIKTSPPCLFCECSCKYGQ